MDAKKYQVVETNVERVGNIWKMPHEKICRNGNNMGMLTIVFYNDRHVKEYQNVVFFTDELIQQSRNFVKGEFIRIKGLFKQEEDADNDSLLLQAQSIQSLCLPKHAWA